MTSTGTAAVENDVRDRIAIALDVPELGAAVELMRAVAPWVGIAKVGLELYSAAGPAAVEQLRALDVGVFADLKFHDIPTTVERAARVIGAQGVAYLNFHAAGGIDMVRAGVEGLAAGAARAGHASPRALAVTVLTSDTDAHAFGARLQVAIDAGCAGVVCSMHEVGDAHAARADLVTVVPGIRLVDDEHHDQQRVGTPDAAMSAGADVIVVGRAITAADDPVRAARTVHAMVARGVRG